MARQGCHSSIGGLRTDLGEAELVGGAGDDTHRSISLTAWDLSFTAVLSTSEVHFEADDTQSGKMQVLTDGTLPNVAKWWDRLNSLDSWKRVQAMHP